tara:strand:- start:192 stop:482 length:291 start_codon:yes stop_codon:yes gene_type:complete
MFCSRTECLQFTGIDPRKSSDRVATRRLSIGQISPPDHLTFLIDGSSIINTRYDGLNRYVLSPISGRKRLHRQWQMTADIIVEVARARFVIVAALV